MASYISNNQIETWLYSQFADHYEMNLTYVNELFDILTSWMETNGYTSRTTNDELYHNFIEFLYKSSRSSNFYKQRRPLCIQI